MLGVGRKGKSLAAPLDDGQTRVAHLGMSGRFTVGDPTEAGPLTPIFERYWTMDVRSASSIRAPSVSSPS